MSANRHTPEEWATIGRRLKWAVEHQPARGRQRGLRLFQRDMKARAEEVEGLTGVYLSSIQGYLRDEVKPSLGFLDEAARVLKVRAVWLTHGEGWPTKEEQEEWDLFGEPLKRRNARIRAALGPGVEAYRSYEDRVRRAIGDGIPGFWNLPHAARRSILAGFREYESLPSTMEEFAHERPADIWNTKVERFATYMSSPFEALRIDPGVLGVTEHAMIADALLRPIEIARWALTEAEETDST